MNVTTRALFVLLAAACSTESHEADAAPSVDATTTACGTGLYPSNATTEGSLMHDGITRAFRVHVPAAHDGTAPLPLVLVLHGGGGSGRQIENGSGMSAIADREGFIAVYPDGTGRIRTWNGGGCCGSAVSESVDDVGFFAALLDHLEGSLCVDPARVYATGMSNGGIMSHRLACELADRLAAIAPVAGTDMTTACTPSRPVAVMQVHGSADGHVPWDGGMGCGPAGVPFTSVPETIARWQSRDGCGASLTRFFEEGDGHCERSADCTGAEVALCTIEGGGHSWPGGAPAPDVVECPGDGAQSTTFHASEAIWRFFADHPMR
ncbi:alpha/beta hydrolase family esterase [Sandaracinus amylolyticus]|uniref:extracellular catalytic domain type 1 short-chain-length polyhydroxyalkanoate depolymerase n=1 Tax=Sandaracinus amylolyticus TaxID=927083 RepID=UPI001F34A185|nr:PHB depolymerase family esterase [Sandaracinus amylolyticus]UJR84625.1 Hypothetical protein I5071_67040 [Sandaracinus amylolyticus]